MKKKNRNLVKIVQGARRKVRNDHSLPSF